MNARGWPWRDADVVLVVLTGLAGLTAIGAAWFGASGTAALTRQAGWLNLAVAGVAASGLGFALWLMRGRRAVGERRAALIALEPQAPEPEAQSKPAHRAAPVPRPAQGTMSPAVVRVPGMQRTHDPGCPLVAGKEVEPASRDAGEPCAVCTP